MKKRSLVLTVLTIAALSVVSCGKTDKAQETNEQQTGVANPWRDCTEEEAYQYAPNGFSAPEGSTNVRWSICMAPDDRTLPGTMVQMNFDYDGLSFTAREQAVPGEEITDISGMYYDWIDSDEQILANWGGGNMKARFYWYAGEDEYAQLALWFDIETGYAYSLSTVATDLDGFDIQSVVEKIYDPAKQIGANAPE